MEEKKNENLNDEIDGEVLNDTDDIIDETDAEEYSPKHSKRGFASLSKKEKIYYSIIGLIIIALLVVLIYWLIQTFKPGPNYDQYKNTDKPVIPEVTENDELPKVENPVDFEKIQEVNPDVCAWIEVDGIDVIDYPILQSASDVDDNYYLDHDIYGNSSSTGAIYIQKLNSKDFSDRNTLIYGHNMLNGSMFGQLKKFKNADFFNQNRYIYIYTPDYVYQYEIVSAFIYDNRHIMNSFNFDIENECQAFFDEVNNPSTYTKQVVDGLNLTTDDKIITLSTCTSNDSERYLVVGRLIKTAKAVSADEIAAQESQNAESN